ncbi:alpha-N-acetylgalactosaminide alpha-2,6-sialyltransferase 3-like [Protopterus annectens]|uniref:alpha-N-acetylgalactosaminide alpha-2,6-sialyltransferase 3-like n=1 Tax=Protopterus annectens TaxID=7888 RepID=UPI001CFB4A0E|nr:alpha-N-acetylgalactosaminide alpha-2,6-sialyltransferase 3-like [Protopterus annectens]
MAHTDIEIESSIPIDTVSLNNVEIPMEEGLRAEVTSVNRNIVSEPALTLSTPPPNQQAMKEPTLFDKFGAKPKYTLGQATSVFLPLPVRHQFRPQARSNSRGRLKRKYLGEVMEPLQLYCQSCSIVSNSGQMQGHHGGAKIDQSSCVWRMNNAPTKGFEEDVGRKTTLRVVSHTSVPLLIQNQDYFFNQANDTTYIIWGPFRNMRQDGKGIVYNMLRKISTVYPGAKIFITTEDRMNYCDKVFQRETGKDR